MGYLYNEFTMKTDLEKEYIKIATKRKAYLDSMYTSVVNQKEKLSTIPLNEREAALKEYTNSENTFNEQAQDLENKNQTLVNDMKQQILKRINMYVAEYGEKNGFTYILANQGTGVLMFADSTKDISNEVLVYMNTQYSGASHE